MKRNFRDSTQTKSDQLKAKLKKRELESKRRKSRQLIRQAELSQASISEALELSVVSQSAGVTSGDKTDTSAKDTTTEEEDIGFESQDEFWYDTSNVELIQQFIESPVTPASVSNQDPDTWSSVNRFFPEGCILSPAVRPLRRAASLPTLAIRPSVPTLSGGISQISSNTSYESPPSPALTVIEMDVNSKFKELKKLASSIDILIERYNDSTINILDKDDYKSELKLIFDKPEHRVQCVFFCAWKLE